MRLEGHRAGGGIAINEVQVGRTMQQQVNGGALIGMEA